LSSSDETVPLLVMTKQSATLNDKGSTVSDETSCQKQTENEWEQSSERPPVMRDRIRDAIILVDARFQITFLNPPAEELTGWSQAEALGKSLREVFRITDHGGLLSADAAFKQVSQERSAANVSASTSLLHRNGTNHSVGLLMSPVRRKDGSVTGAVVAFHEISDEPCASNDRETDARKEEFLAMLAHELRNPLAPIRSGLDLLALDQTANQETVDLMKHQLEYLVRLVDDLLDVSRIVQGKVRLRRERVDLSQIVRRAVDSVNFLVQRRSQKLIISLPADGVLMYADPVRVTQVLGNLLHNASKFTAEGGRIELTVEPEGKMVLIRVRDNGMGINRHMLNKVFDLFTQGASAIDRSEGGLGIGLTLVKSLVEMHGGTVIAASEGLGKGAVFTVALPLMDQPKRIETQPGPPVPESPRRILVVDDNVGAAKMLSLLLSRLGPHEVRTAHDGNTTFALAEDFRPDIIFLDIGLPAMDGFEVARRIRANAKLNNILLVAVTGYGQDEDRRKSREAGFDEHLVKPVDVASLRRMISHPKLPATQV
jgi:PAS domain S-box-containing protein